MAARVLSESRAPGQRLRDGAAAQAALLREPGAAAPAPSRSEPGDAGDGRPRDPLLAAVGRGDRGAPERDRDGAGGDGLRLEAPHAARRARPPSVGRWPRSSSPTRSFATPGSRCRRTRKPGTTSASSRPTTACRRPRTAIPGKTATHLPAQTVPALAASTPDPRRTAMTTAPTTRPVPPTIATIRAKAAAVTTRAHRTVTAGPGRQRSERRCRDRCAAEP